LAPYPVPQGSQEPVLEDELRRLAAIVPNLTFQANPNNPRVIHAVDQRLAGVQGYSMDQVLPDVRFTGMLTGLLAEIAARGIRIAPTRAAAPGDPLVAGFDGTTSVQTNPAPMTVRSILSDFLPLTVYGRVLWTATTERRAGAVTAVNFRGLHSQEQTSFPLLAHLYWLGQEHDAFFTIEESWIKDEAMNSFVSHSIPLDSTQADLKDEMRRLGSIVPNFQFQIDAKNPHIVHIKDARLAAKEPYSLDQTVQNIEKVGTLPDLIAAIARRGVAVTFETVSVSPGGHLPDFVTVVHVKAEKATVRSLLTDFLPLANYKRILWTATTERRPSALTVVDFYGPTMYGLSPGGPPK